MKKYLHAVYTLLLLQLNSLSATAQYNPATNTFETGTSISNASASSPDAQPSPGNPVSGINCDGNTFWAINNIGQIREMSLVSGTISNHGIINAGSPGKTIAFCNNLNGGSFSSTFYTSSTLTFSTSYFNGVNWTSGNGNSSAPLYNSGGNGAYLYFLGGSNISNTILRYTGNSFDTVFYDPALKISVAGLGVDDHGNIFCFRGTQNDTCNFIDVISPTGNVLKRYNVNLNSYHAYGCFLLNSVLYVGLGPLNAYHPNSLIPFAFTPDSARQGSPIQMPAGNYYDLAGCSAGLPEFSYPALLLTTTSTPVMCNNTSSGTAVALASGGLPPYTFYWSNGFNTYSQNNLSVGNYTVTVADQLGNSVSGTVSVAQATGPAVLIDADKTAICPSDSVHLCADASGVTNYQWNSGETTQCIYTSVAGNHYVTVTDTYHCSAESNHISIYVYPAPAVSISVNGDTLEAYNASSYQWFLGGILISSAVSPTFVPHGPGIYNVQITDSLGCSALSSPVVISSIGQGIEDAGWFELYPNPVTDILHIRTEAKHPQFVTLFNVQGEKLLQQKFTPSLDMSFLSNGTYFLEVQTENGAARKKFIRK